jgi:hypothetical protein
MKTERHDLTADVFAKTDGIATTNAPRKASPRPRGELFARITERHCALLAGVEGPSTVILFNYLMMYSVRVFHHPFELPVDYLTKKTGMSRRQQLRAVRMLVEVGIVKDGREKRFALPVIVIPGTSRTARKAT